MIVLVSRSTSNLLNTMMKVVVVEARVVYLRKNNYLSIQKDKPSTFSIMASTTTGGDEDFEMAKYTNENQADSVIQDIISAISRGLAVYTLPAEYTEVASDGSKERI